MSKKELVGEVQKVQKWNWASELQSTLLGYGSCGSSRNSNANISPSLGVFGELLTKQPCCLQSYSHWLVIFPPSQPYSRAISCLTSTKPFPIKPFFSLLLWIRDLLKISTMRYNMCLYTLLSFNHFKCHVSFKWTHSSVFFLLLPWLVWVLGNLAGFQS